MCMVYIYIWYEYTYVQELVCGVYGSACVCFSGVYVYVSMYISMSSFVYYDVCLCVSICVCAIYVSEYMCVHVFMFVNSCVCVHISTLASFSLLTS